VRVKLKTANSRSSVTVRPLWASVLLLCVVWMVLQFMGRGCLCSCGRGSWWGDTDLQYEPRDARQSRKPRYVHM